MAGDIDKKAFGRRAAARREAVGLSQVNLASLIGMRQQGIAAIENGEVERPRKLHELVKELRTTQEWLLYGRPPEEMLADEPSMPAVGVMGRIGAGGSIDTSAEQQTEPLYEISVPFPIPPEAIAFEVSGESMWPRYDPGDVIVCLRQGTNLEDLIGYEAAVQTDDGARYLKRVLRTEVDGVFTLESHNASPMRGVRLTWWSSIAAVVRANQVHRVNGHSRRKIVAQVKSA